MDFSDTQNLLLNQRLSQKINLMSRLLNLLKDVSLHDSTRSIIISLIRVLLVTYKTTGDILKYFQHREIQMKKLEENVVFFSRVGQFLVYLLPSSSISEKNVTINNGKAKIFVFAKRKSPRNKFDFQKKLQSEFKTSF